MFALVITVHVITCALLILIVLVQQGRGGGLIDSLSSAESIFGTKTNTFLVKSTSVLAVVFFITCLSLAFLSVQKSKSLIETSYRPTAASQSQTQTQTKPLTTSGTTAQAPSPAPAVSAEQPPKTSSVAETPSPAQSTTSTATQPSQTPSAP
jgi:preprotein translocase subunit SecG